MAKRRRLPFPGLYSDPLGPAPKPSAHDMAVKYLKWHCAKHGIELPTDHYRNTLTYSFYFERGECLAYISRNIPESRDHRDRRVLAHTEQEAKIVLPAWAMPYKRVDMWHAAHQAGGSMETCNRVANTSRWESDHKALCDAATTMDAPDFTAFLAERAARQERERIAREAENKALGIKWFDDEYARTVAIEGDDGLGIYLEFDFMDRVSLAKMTRNQWLKQAKHCRDYRDIGEERIAMCIARARLFHRQFMDMQQNAA